MKNFNHEEACEIVGSVIQALREMELGAVEITSIFASGLLTMIRNTHPEEEFAVQAFGEFMEKVGYGGEERRYEKPIKIKKEEAVEFDSDNVVLH